MLQVLDQTTPAASASTATIHLACKNYANTTYLIAVNDSPGPVEATLTVPSATGPPASTASNWCRKSAVRTFRPCRSGVNVPYCFPYSKCINP